MKSFLLLSSFIFGLVISASVLKFAFQSGTKDVINNIGISAILIFFGFYPFNFLLLINHKQGIASILEKVLQWPFFGNKAKVPTNLGPWWVNRAENAILLTSFVPFLLILFFMWLAKIILVRQNMT